MNDKLPVEYPVAAILMASGFSRRFGPENKLLTPFKGKPLARYALELAVEFNFTGGIYLITTSSAVADLAADLSSVSVIRNSAPENGLRESARLGVQASGAKAEFYLFIPCDQPFLDAATVKSVLAVREAGCIIEPRYKGKPGNPCLFSKVFKKELLSLGEGETPKVLKERYPQALKGVETSSPLALKDIDDEKTHHHYSNIT